VISSYVWGEVLIFVSLLIVNGGSSYQLTLLIGKHKQFSHFEIKIGFSLFPKIALIVLQLLLHIQTYVDRRSLDQNEGSHVLVSPSGFVKLFVFFIQTNASINAQFWTAFDDIGAKVSFFPLRMSGLRCGSLGETLFSHPTNSFLTFMLVPISLSLIICVFLVIKTMLRWLFGVAKEAIRKHREKKESLFVFFFVLFFFVTFDITEEAPH
jgi:hypothetical protein